MIFILVGSLGMFLLVFMRCIHPQKCCFVSILLVGMAAGGLSYSIVVGRTSRSSLLLKLLEDRRKSTKHPKNHISVNYIISK